MLEGPYARISLLRPHDGDTVGFESGYVRHLEWHRQARDTWRWYGWTIWAGERQRWFVYGTFGHSAASLDNPVDPLGDERDNISNVTPHGSFLGHALCEFLPALSRGSGVPSPAARVELTTVDLAPGAGPTFEETVGGHREALQGETLWYRVLAGGPSPRYLRLRPHGTVSSLLDAMSEQPLPDGVNAIVAKTTIEVMNLRPAMCYGVTQAVR